jgi:hypothetical protein
VDSKTATTERSSRPAARKTFSRFAMARSAADQDGWRRAPRSGKDVPTLQEITGKQQGMPLEARADPRPYFQPSVSRSP